MRFLEKNYRLFSIWLSLLILTLAFVTGSDRPVRAVCVTAAFFAGKAVGTGVVFVVMSFKLSAFVFAVHRLISPCTYGNTGLQSGAGQQNGRPTLKEMDRPDDAPKQNFAGNELHGPRKRTKTGRTLKRAGRTGGLYGSLQNRHDKKLHLFR